MKVIDCARAAGVSADTVRHYAALGLIQAPARTASGYQLFTPDTVERIRFIRAAVGLGFRLSDVAELLHMSEQGHLPCPRARAILARRLAEKQHQMERELALFNRMKQALDAWQHMPDGVPAGHHVCGLIEGLPSPRHGQHSTDGLGSGRDISCQASRSPAKQKTRAVVERTAP